MYSYGIVYNNKKRNPKPSKCKSKINSLLKYTVITVSQHNKPVIFIILN